MNYFTATLCKRQKNYSKNKNNKKYQLYVGQSKQKFTIINKIILIFCLSVIKIAILL